MYLFIERGVDSLSEFFDWDPPLILLRLREAGFFVYLGADGSCHGVPMREGIQVTLELRPAVEALRVQNEGCAALLRKEPKTKRYDDLTLWQAKALGKLVKRGDFRLIGDALYHRGSGRVSLTLERVAE